jgi:hypothetical protein
MKKRSVLSSIIVVFALFAFTLAIAPAAQAAYPEPDKVIELMHHSSTKPALSRTRSRSRRTREARLPWRSTT